MADKKISQLTGATTPLDGTEVLPIVKSGATVKVANNDLRPKQIQSNATSGVLQVTGPAAGTTRVMTVPDANFTAARTNTGQTFTGNQIFDGTLTARRSSGDFTGYSIGYGGVDNPILSFNMTDGSGRYRFNMNSDVDIKFETNVGGSWAAAWQVTRVGRDVTVNNGNLVIGTAGKGIDFSADGQAAGMTSELLSDYEEGTWTPTQGAALSVVGSFSSSGTYTKVGRLVTLVGTLSGSTSISSSTGIICGGLPFSPANTSSGSAAMSSINAGSTLYVAGSIYAVTAMAGGGGGIVFMCTFFV